jgi:hypothetical protein
MVRFRFRFGRNVPEDVRREMRAYLLDKELGWTALGYELVEADAARKCDVVIRLQPAKRMNEMYGDIERLRGMSVTDSGARPRRIDLHETNWFAPPEVFQHNPELTLSRVEQYHCYLCNHEMGHALDYGHSKHVAGQPCPVMYQQTRGTGESICVANPWPAVRAE